MNGEGMQCYRSKLSKRLSLGDVVQVDFVDGRHPAVISGMFRNGAQVRRLSSTDSRSPAEIPALMMVSYELLRTAG